MITALFATTLLCTTSLVLANPFSSGTCFATANDIAMSRPKKVNESGGIQLSLDKTQYTPGANVVVQLSGATFCGFLLYAENRKGKRVGQFNTPDGSQVMESCPGETGSTVTHTQSFDSNDSISFTWTPGAINHGFVKFIVVVLSSVRKDAENQQFFWPSPVEIASSAGALATPPPISNTACPAPIVVSVCPELQAGVVKWSEWAKRPRSASESGVIEKGEIVLLDQSVAFKQLDIYGQLVFDPSAAADIRVQAEFIYVHQCARFFLGSEECPAMGAYDIELVGDALPDVDPLGFGTKVLAGFPGAQIDIHGAPVSFAWTSLGAHAKKGATSITLAEEPKGWKIGQEIVITNTGSGPWGDKLEHRNDRNERRTIKFINGKTIDLSGSALQFDHYGEFLTKGSHQIDMRGEVGLLNRNIVFHGSRENGAESAGWGGHIMGLGSVEMRIENIEVTKMGQRGELGRYPIHFHVTRDNPNSYVRQNSIHDTYQRCVTVHGTNKLLIQGNVGFNAVGHCFFIEDGDETGNIFDRNLGIEPKMGSLLVSDKQPAVFWVTNPSSHFYRNHAVGGFFGFWYALPIHPTGKARNSDVEHKNWIRQKPMGDFIQNVAHSSSSGFFNDQGLKNDAGETERFTSYIPTDLSNSLAWLDELKSNQRPVNFAFQYGPILPGHVVEFTSYKHSLFGLWARGSGTVVSNSMFVDNAIGTSMPQGKQIVQNSVYVGLSDNEPDEPHLPYWIDSPLIGYQSYDAGNMNMLIDVEFYDFKDQMIPPGNGVVYGKRSAGAISGQTGPNSLPPHNRFYGLKFTNVDNRVYYRRFFPQSDGLVDLWLLDIAMQGIVHYDFDGSLTGTCGAAVVGGSALLRSAAADCTEQEESNSFLCKKGNYAQIGFNAAGSVAQVPENFLHIRRIGTDDSVQLPVTDGNGQIYDCGGKVCEAKELEFNTNVELYHEYLVSVGDNIPVQFVIGAALRSYDSWMKFVIPVASRPSLVKFEVDGKPDVLESSSLETLGEGDSRFFYEQSAGLLHLLIKPLPSFLAQDDEFGGYISVDISTAISVAFDCPVNKRVADAVNQPTLCEADVTLSQLQTTITLPKPALKICDDAASFTDVQLKSGGAEPHVIFDDQFRNGWSIMSFTKGTQISGDLTETGSAALQVKWPKGGAEDSQLFLLSLNAPMSRGSYTHLQMSVRMAPTYTKANIVAGAFHGESFDDESARSRLIYLHSSFVSAQGTPVNFEWRTFNIPLEEIAPGETQFLRVLLAHYQHYPIEFYVDNIRLIEATTSVKPKPNFPRLFDVPTGIAENLNLPLPGFFTPSTPSQTTAVTSPASGTAAQSSQKPMTNVANTRSTTAANTVSAENTTSDSPTSTSTQLDFTVDDQGGNCGDIHQICLEQCGAGQVQKCKCTSAGDREVECKEAMVTSAANLTISLLLTVGALLLTII